MVNSALLLRSALQLALIAALITPRPSRADDSDPGVSTDDALQKRLAAVARSFTAVDRESSRTVEIADRPVLSWVNPIRNERQQQGLMYVWEQDGRPAIVGTAFSYVWSGERRIKMELHSLSQSALQMHRDEQVVWTPTANAIEWRLFSDAPAPSSNARQRLVQMRQLARRFRVSTISSKKEEAFLRLLPQPLHRYKSPRQSVVDGAVFSFVVATDPDALLLIEHVRRDGAEHFQYAFARFHYWAVRATDSGNAVVWEAATDMAQEGHHIGDVSQFEKPYVSFQVEAWPEQEPPPGESPSRTDGT